MSNWSLKQVRASVYMIKTIGEGKLIGAFEKINQMIREEQRKETRKNGYWSVKRIKPHYYLLETIGKVNPKDVAEDFIGFIEHYESQFYEQKLLSKVLCGDEETDIKDKDLIFSDINMEEADGLSPTASGKEGEDLPGFSSEEFPSSIHPVEEEEASAEAPWSLKELLEEDSFTISSIDQMEEEENVGVMPNISEDDGEMSAPTSSRVNREMSAPTDSRDNREMSAPTDSRNIEEMSALNIPIATWRDAIVGDCSLNIQTRERIIAEVLKPHFVVPPKGSREWELLDHVVMMERRRQDMIWRQSLLPEKRDEGLRKRLALDSFYKATKCGRLRAYSAPVRRHLLLHLLN